MGAAWRKRLLKNPLVDAVAHPSTRFNAQRLARHMRGKRVLITGASHGIGEATARLLGGAGARVLLVARSEERLAEVADDIRARGGRAWYYSADLTDTDQVDELLTAMEWEAGGLDMFVNNAGKSIRRSFALARQRDYERTLAVNYLGPVKLLLGVVPGMRARRSGQVINISTVGVGFPPAARWGAYQASKEAFDTLFRSIGLEARHDQVLFSSLYLPLVYTRMSAPTPQLREGMAPGMTADEAAALVARAIVEQKRVIAPWWYRPTEVAVLLLRPPIAAVLSFWFARTDDTRSARMARRETESDGDSGDEGR